LCRSFIRDCKICNSHFTARHVEKIFLHVLQRDKISIRQSDDGTLQFNEKDKDVDCRQFVEILIRIAHARVPSNKERADILTELKKDQQGTTNKYLAMRTTLFNVLFYLFVHGFINRSISMFDIIF
jgi:hypothetical protein